MQVVEDCAEPGRKKIKYVRTDNQCCWLLQLRRVCRARTETWDESAAGQNGMCITDGGIILAAG